MSTLQGNTNTIENLLQTVNNLPAVGADDAVLYIDQTLTDAQKAQARTNIGAASEEEVAGKMDKVTGTEDQVIGFDENGNPVAREAPSGGSVQTDWNQADETAADFLKNKPFRETKVEIIPETEVTGADEGGVFVYYFSASGFAGNEERLLITLDGAEYEVAMFDSGHGFPVYGNLKYIGGLDTGEPFCLAVLVSDGIAGIYMDDGEPHTVKIGYNAIKKVDEKYLPGSIVLYADPPFVFSSMNFTEETIVTKAKLKEMVLSGRHIYTLVDGLYVSPMAFAITLNEPHATISFAEELGLTLYTAEYTG